MNTVLTIGPPALVLLAAAALAAASEAWTYDVPGGADLRSDDYAVTVEADGKAHRAFVQYSRGRDEYIRCNWQGEFKEKRPYGRRGVASHSAACFSFRGKVTVRVTVAEGAEHIALPLTSAKVLPSSYGIPCTVEDGNTIVFTLDRPEKVAVIPNYDKAMAVYERRGRGHVPARSWRDEYRDLLDRKSFHGGKLKSLLSEGFRNPLIVLAHGPERDVPEKASAGTLVVRPGDEVTQARIDGCRTVWFAPGVHDLSELGEAPWQQVLVGGGQTMYLEGGSYVFGRFKRRQGGSGEACVRGRGTLSGGRHKWILNFQEGSQVIGIDRLTGITITDRACFGIHGGRVIDDIAMLGAWHGNTDGPDYVDDCTITNSFLMAHDDNLKLNDNTRARHLVIWQLANAHAIMVKEMRDNVTFADSVVEDVDIIAYLRPPSGWKHPWGRLGPAAIACITGSDLKIRNFTYRDIRIESPYLFRVFCVYNLDTNRPYAPKWFTPTSASRHTRIDGMLFKDITVNTPVIAYRSLLGSGYDDSLSNIRFVNLRINGRLVTEANCEEFFEIERDRIDGLEFTAADRRGEQPPRPGGRGRQRERER